MGNKKSDVTLLRPEVKRALLDQAYRRDFMFFIRRTFETVEPGKKLHLYWHTSAIAQKLDEVISGKNRRLIITLPPRSLKTIVTSVALPAFVLGLDPTKKIVCVSYSEQLAVKSANDCRHVMRSDWYKRAFPHTRISSEKNTEVDFMTTRRGGRFTTSISGTLTGRGGDLFVIDDLLNAAEAQSESSRARAKDWLESTLMSRLNDKARSAVVLVMQRLHVDDPVGVLIEKGGWHLLNIPAIAEEEQAFNLYCGGLYLRRVGEVLDPIREPRHVLDEVRRSMGSLGFSAQYQQNPIPAEGNLIRREWLRYYEKSPPFESRDMLVISWDTAMKAEQLSDYTVGTMWLVKGNTCYLLDLMRAKFGFPQLKRAVLAARAKWPAASVLIEDKGSGTSLIQQLREENVSVIGIKTVDDKITRLYATGPMFESGSVMFPKNASWLPDFENELMAFPNARHDDQVDSLSQALTWIRQRQNAPKPNMFIYSTNDDVSSYSGGGYRDYY